MPEATVSHFEIEGLRGQRNVSLRMDDNTLILVGENGSGKTTILRLLFYFLSGKWAPLGQFEFKTIRAKINGKKFELDAREIPREPGFDRNMLRHINPSLRRRISEAEERGAHSEAALLFESYYGSSLPGAYSPKIQEMFEELNARGQSVANEVGAQVLYLPTYRRIERELTGIFSGLDPDDLKRGKFQTVNDDSFIELVEFGMGDVQKAISDTLEKIRGFANTALNGMTLTYLGDVVSQNYLSSVMDDIVRASDATVLSVINRISSTILRDEQKSLLKDIVLNARDTSNITNEHERIVLHYFGKLLKFQSALQDKEKDIRAFCELTSHYIVDKKFIYDTQRFSFRIEWADERRQRRPRVIRPTIKGDEIGDVKLSDLSSGEKQIVSLFSHMYLSGRDRYFVLIDEPELSLSVPWQRRFLEDIRQGSFCSGLIAVTHSPFIYDNSLRPHAHALGEFLHGPDWGFIQ